MRKSAVIDIDDKDSRDAGLRLIVEEMPATEGTKFAFQAFQLMAAAGIDIDIDGLRAADDTELVRIAGQVAVRAVTALPPAEFEAYLQWFMRYTYWQNPSDAKAKRQATADDIHEISTYFRIIFESARVNLGTFFTGIGPLLRSLRKKQPG